MTINPGIYQDGTVGEAAQPQMAALVSEPNISRFHELRGRGLVSVLAH